MKKNKNKIMVIGSAPFKYVNEAIKLSYSLGTHTELHLLVNKSHKYLYKSKQYRIYSFRKNLSWHNIYLIYYLFKIRPDIQIITCGGHFFHYNIIQALVVISLFFNKSSKIFIYNRFNNKLLSEFNLKDLLISIHEYTILYIFILIICYCLTVYYFLFHQ